MASGEGREPLDGAVEIGDEGVDGGTQLEHQRGVDDVLAGRPPMHVRRGCRIGLGDLGSERIDQRSGDVAGRRGFLAERLDVVALGAGGGGDLVGGERRNDADRRFRACERDLEIEHALQPRAIIQDGAHGGARDQRGEQRGWAERIGHGLRRGETPIATCTPLANPQGCFQEPMAVHGGTPCRDATKALSPLLAKVL